VRSLPTPRWSWCGTQLAFKSSLTGETCQEMADDYEKRTGQQ
jgi:hypothetical protein